MLGEKGGGGGEGEEGGGVGRRGRERDIAAYKKAVKLLTTPPRQYSDLNQYISLLAPQILALFHERGEEGEGEVGGSGYDYGYEREAGCGVLAAWLEGGGEEGKEGVERWLLGPLCDPLPFLCRGGIPSSFVSSTFSSSSSPSSPSLPLFLLSPKITQALERLTCLLSATILPPPPSLLTLLSSTLSPLLRLATSEEILLTNTNTTTNKAMSLGVRRVAEGAMKTLRLFFGMCSRVMSVRPLLAFLSLGEGYFEENSYYSSWISSSSPSSSSSSRPPPSSSPSILYKVKETTELLTELEVSKKTTNDPKNLLPSASLYWYSLSPTPLSSSSPSPQNEKKGEFAFKLIGKGGDKEGELEMEARLFISLLKTECKQVFLNIVIF